MDSIISNFSPIVIECHGDREIGFSVLVKDIYSPFSACVDVDIFSDDIRVAWNQYIFFLNNSADLFKKSMQENHEISEKTFSEAIQFLEITKKIYHSKNGWHYVY